MTGRNHEAINRWPAEQWCVEGFSSKPVEAARSLLEPFEACWSRSKSIEASRSRPKRRGIGSNLEFRNANLELGTAKAHRPLLFKWIGSMLNGIGCKWSAQSVWHTHKHTLSRRWYNARYNVVQRTKTNFGEWSTASKLSRLNSLPSWLYILDTYFKVARCIAWAWHGLLSRLDLLTLDLLTLNWLTLNWLAASTIQQSQKPNDKCIIIQCSFQATQFWQDNRCCDVEYIHQFLIDLPASLTCGSLRLYLCLYLYCCYFLVRPFARSLFCSLSLSLVVQL